MLNDGRIIGGSGLGNERNLKRHLMCLFPQCKSQSVNILSGGGKMQKIEPEHALVETPERPVRSQLRPGHLPVVPGGSPTLARSVFPHALSGHFPPVICS